jgi:hypothetical protein
VIAPVSQIARPSSSSAGTRPAGFSARYSGERSVLSKGHSTTSNSIASSCSSHSVRIDRDCGTWCSRIMPRPPRLQQDQRCARLHLRRPRHQNLAPPRRRARRSGHAPSSSPPARPAARPSPRPRPALTKTAFTSPGIGASIRSPPPPPPPRCRADRARRKRAHRRRRPRPAPASLRPRAGSPRPPAASPGVSRHSTSSRRRRSARGRRPASPRHLDVRLVLHQAHVCRSGAQRLKPAEARRRRAPSPRALRARHRGGAPQPAA